MTAGRPARDAADRPAARSPARAGGRAAANPAEGAGGEPVAGEVAPGARAGEEPGAAFVARQAERSEISDPHALRALAHPTRMRLLEALTREGPLTATQAATLLDESPGNISWHLQTLARYGFIEETGTGRGRSRPWRLVALGQSFLGGVDEEAGTLAADELAGVIVEQSVARLRAWPSVRHAFAPEWHQATFFSQMLLYLTADELDQMGRDLVALGDRYRERTLDRARRPAGAAPVQLVSWGRPLEPSPTGS